MPIASERNRHEYSTCALYLLFRGPYPANNFINIDFEERVAQSRISLTSPPVRALAFFDFAGFGPPKTELVGDKLRCGFSARYQLEVRLSRFSLVATAQYVLVG